MNVRIGNYEIRPYNAECYVLCEVLPEGFDNSRAKYTTSVDGRALRPLDKYPTNLGQAVRLAREIALKREDRAVVADIDGALDRLDELNREFADTAARIERAAAR